MIDETLTIVLDIGSYSCKGGFSGEEVPKSVIRSLVGFPKYIGCPGFYKRSYYTGNEALSMIDKLNFCSPFEKGIINNFSCFEHICHNLFYYGLRVDPSEFNILLTEPSFNSKLVREKVAFMMFETFNVSSIYISNKSVLPIYTSGINTGVVIDCGYNSTHIVPIYEGYPIKHAIETLDIGGKELEDFFIKLIKPKTNDSPTFAEREEIRDIKDKFCYVSFDFNKEKETPKSSSDIKNIKLKFEKSLQICDECFICPEILFNPSQFGYKSKDLANALKDSINKCDIDIQKQLYSNMVLSGGSTLFFSFTERLYKEIEQIAGDNGENINIFSHPERLNGTWIGGSIFSSLNSFNNILIKKSDFEEEGENIFNYRCLF